MHLLTWDTLSSITSVDRKITQGYQLAHLLTADIIASKQDFSSPLVAELILVRLLLLVCGFRLPNNPGNTMLTTTGSSFYDTFDIQNNRVEREPSGS